MPSQMHEKAALERIINGKSWEEGNLCMQRAIKNALIAEMEKQDREFTSKSYSQIGTFCGRMARKIVEHEAFEELWKQIKERAEAEISDRISASRGDIEYQRKQLEEQSKSYEDLIRRWSDLDETTRRFEACISDIEDLLPIEGDNYTKQQAIRSRGLVLAAIFGLRQMGSLPQKGTDDGS